MTSGTIRITARTLDLAREALATWVAENPRRALDRTMGAILPNCGLQSMDKAYHLPCFH